jgi:hypothetical protein
MYLRDPLHSVPAYECSPWWPTLAKLTKLILTTILVLVTRYLTPRFSPALAVETSRYQIWFNVALNNAELFHALIALSQVYYNIDVQGFGHTHWTALYHRGEALRHLRVKVETAKSADDDAAILTTLWLMDVDVSVVASLLCSTTPSSMPLLGTDVSSRCAQAAHGDLHAYAMHKRAKDRMVTTRGGIRSLNAELQDELLKCVYTIIPCLPARASITLTIN